MVCHFFANSRDLLSSIGVLLGSADDFDDLSVADLSLSNLSKFVLSHSEASFLNLASS